MINSVYKTLILCIIVILISCAAPPNWRQFHGDLPNRGFQLVNSEYALSPVWISEPNNITSSSPVIGKDSEGNEVIYVGAVNGKFVAINAEDGSEKWNLFFGSLAGGIISSPAVSENGDIYFITNSEPDVGRPSSFLHKADEFGNLKWSFYEFPDNGFTSSSPKLLQVGDETLIFVYVTFSGKGELFVLRDGENAPELLDRKALAACGLTGGGLFDDLKDIWDSLKCFNPLDPTSCFDPSGSPLPDNFIDPTVAIVSEGRQQPLIAIADNVCSIGAYEWNGTALEVVWRKEHDNKRHSSPIILPNNLMAFGRKNGQVLAYDVESGEQVWEYDAGEAVFATPAATLGGRFIFVVSKIHIHVLDTADGTLVHDGDIPRKLKLLGQTYASPAVTANRVYVSVGLPEWEMLTLSYDLKVRAHDPSFRGNGLSSLAVGDDGSIYAVTFDGTIRKYLGTE